MKRKIFVINETKGFFTEDEENLCKEYCRVNGYTYRIRYINIEVDKIERKNKNMWETTEFKSIEHPHTVRMTFELPYLDWCRFENSELFHQLTAYLEGLEKQNIQYVPIPKKHKFKFK